MISVPFFAAYDTGFQNLVSQWITLMLAVAFICFVVSEITRNYSQVDKLWSIMPIFYGGITVKDFSSDRVLLMWVLVTLWGLRLSYNFYRKGGYSYLPWKGAEDYRWKILRDNPLLKGRLRFGLFNLLFISFYQNFLILLFSTPFLLAALYQDKPLSAIDYTIAGLMLLFIITESIADNQLFRFHKEKNGTSKGSNRYDESLKRGFMTEGIWKYVRHPNFASEQAIWICFYFFGVAASGRWINFTIAGPVLLVLLFIGSTMFTEKISAGKYPEYALRQKEVPRFIPNLFRNSKT